MRFGFAMMFIGAPLLLAICCACQPVNSQPVQAANRDVEPGDSGRASSKSHVEHVVTQIRSEQSASLRIHEAEELAQWIAGPMPKSVSDSDIDALATLMGDSDDAIRFWAAGALGELGQRASRAMPMLLGALAERPCENVPMASAAAIRLAIQRIGGKPANMPCTDPFGS